MEFLIENYVWFIVGAIIILMAIIGYYADKTDFGRKEIKVKKPEPKPVEEEPIEVQEEVKEEKPKKEKKEKKKKNKKKKDEVETQVTEETVSEETTATEENNQEEDLYAVLESMPMAPVDSNEVVDEALFAPLSDDNNEADFEQPIETTEENVMEPINDAIENTDFELQSVEPAVLPEMSTEEVVDSIPEEDDVWKF